MIVIGEEVGGEDLKILTEEILPDLPVKWIHLKDVLKMRTIKRKVSIVLLLMEEKNLIMKGNQTNLSRMEVKITIAHT